MPIHIVKSHFACTCKLSGAARRKGMDSTRPNQKYLAAECNFRVNVCLQLRIMKYRITTIHEVHNHPVFSDHYVLCHDQKKLTKNEIDIVNEQIDLGISIIQLKELIRNKIGKIVDSQDIHNTRNNFTVTN